MISLKAKYLIDGTGSDPVKNPTILVDEGKIVEVSTDESATIPHGTQKFEFSEGTILPGLINLHVHLTHTPGLLGEHLKEESDNILTLRAKNHAQKALRSGITSIREAGCRNRIAFDLKKSMEMGLWNGPRLFVSGPPVSSTGGHGESSGIRCDGPYELRKAVRNLIKNNGADYIKIMATGPTSHTGASDPDFTVEEMAAAVDEAHKLGRKVMAHAVGLEGVSNAIEAGVDDVAHVGEYDSKLAHKIADSGIFVHMTLRASYTRLPHMDKDSDEYNRRKNYVENKIKMLGHLNELGVKIGVGDDGGWTWTTFDNFVEELELMSRSGMTPLEVITAATAISSEVLGMEDKLGTIEQGKLADILVVRGEPFSNLGDLRNVLLVMKEGSIVNEK